MTENNKDTDVMDFINSMDGVKEENEDKEEKEVVDNGLSEDNEETNEDKEDDKEESIEEVKELEDEEEEEDVETEEDEEEEESGEEEEPDEMQLMKDQISELKKKLEERDKEEDKEEDEEEVPEEEIKPSFENINFVETDEAFEEIIGSRDNFNKFFTNYANQIYELAMSRVPTVAAKTMDDRLVLQHKTAEFVNRRQNLFIDNIPEGSSVDSIKQQRWMHWNSEITRIRSENPKMKIEKVMDLAGDNLESLIGKTTSKEVKKSSKRKDKRKPFASKGGNRKSVIKKVDTADFDNEINELSSIM